MCVIVQKSIKVILPRWKSNYICSKVGFLDHSFLWKN